MINQNIDYLIYNRMPASSTSRQISPVDLIYRPKFNYRFPSCFKDRKARFWRNSLAQICPNVKLNIFNLHTYNDKSEVNYLIYEGMPASSKSRQFSPVNVISRPKFNYRFPNCFEDRKARFWRMIFLLSLWLCQVNQF